MLALAVVVVHGLLLSGFHDALPTFTLDRAVPLPPASLNVRTLVPDAPPVAAATMARPVAQARRPSPPALQRHPAAAPAAIDDDAHALAAATPSAPAPDALPVYRTQPPPAFAFIYALQRGAQSGRAELRWLPQGERYEARFVGSSGGATLMTWESAGGFDDAGLSPTRYTDHRHGRGTQAANFQRDTGKVTFSGPAIEHALPPGAQDRLSWMLQLAAIAAADPALVGPGGQVRLLVVGARGEADVWTFAHAGEETLDGPQGSVPTLRLLREPLRPYDTRAEVWLDPARHYLPVRARLSHGAAERDELQLVLREVLAAP